MNHVLLKNSVCATCHARGALVARLVPVEGQRDWLESLVECAQCHTRTHAVFTNVELEMEAAQIHMMFDPVKRGRALLAYKEKFDAFNAAALEAIFDKLKFLFWSTPGFDSATRVRLLVEVGALPAQAAPVQTQEIEMAALEWARGEARLANPFG